VPSTPRTYGDKIEAYIHEYAPIAQEEMKLYKIPASITLAQGILESGAGEGELTRKANNHFGIKCHGWSGQKVYHDDDESQECFRKYKDPKYSYRDHSVFLAERKRYAKLFDLDMNDYKGWAHGLRAAGYATDRRYPEKLISIIERYQLYLYDGDAPAREIAYSAPRSSENAYIVKQGDTLYSIAKRHNITVEQLQKYNNLRDTNIGIGQKLYVAQ
jgi:flagellum-specific peptidoglycan hydrolase FlgJ